MLGTQKWSIKTNSGGPSASREGVLPQRHHGNDEDGNPEDSDEVTSDFSVNLTMFTLHSIYL